MPIVQTVEERTLRATWGVLSKNTGGHVSPLSCWRNAPLKTKLNSESGFGLIPISPIKKASATTWKVAAEEENELQRKPGESSPRPGRGNPGHLESWLGVRLQRLVRKEQLLYEAGTTPLKRKLGSLRPT
ncbi:hypothetical protein LCGC14_2678460 [marine sediment metagenome]|uniref:Uncharacterized protein n=1 Tax=marine sediment metagenome TaxID=412755 RepID=A0A0F9BWY1_9ZZZZ